MHDPNANDRRTAALWAAAGATVLTGRALARALRVRVAVWEVAALAFVAVLAGRALTGLTLGPSHADAAAPAGIEAPAVATTDGADPATADGYGATPTADWRLQPTPGGGLPMLEHAAPGGPDDGTPPDWLPAGLAPWWLDIVAAAHEHGLDSHAWGAIVAQECPWGDPACGSHAGAAGLAQIMPATAADIEANTGLPCRAMAHDGPTSLRCGAWYFAARVRDNGDLWQSPADDEVVLLAAAAAYNGGGNPAADVRRAAQAGAADVCAGVRFDETRAYCYAFRDRWRATLAARGATSTDAPAADAAPWQAPWGPRVAPGVPLAYLEVGR